MEISVPCAIWFFGSTGFVNTNSRVDISGPALTETEDQRKLPDYSRQLDVCAQEFQRLKTAVIKTRDNVMLILPQKYSDFVVSGQASRIDLKSDGGYSIWTFARNDADWRDDPRMPLLQQAYADKLDASLDEIEVGIYDFIAEKHDKFRFDQSAVRNAQRRLLRLLDALI